MVTWAAVRYLRSSRKSTGQSRIPSKFCWGVLSASSRGGVEPSPTEGPVDVTRWDEKAGLRRDAIRSQVIDTRSKRKR